MSDELGECPFCGVDAVLRNVEMVGCCYVACPSCGTNGPDGSKSRAIAAWNTRAPAQVKPLEWDDNSISPDLPAIYHVDGDEEDGWTVYETTLTWTDNLFEDGRTFPTEEAAKAAAQDDYERRIREALL